MSPSLRATRDPKEQSWAGAEQRLGGVSLGSEGRRRKGRENKTSTHAASRFLTKVTPRSGRSGTSSSERRLFPLKEHGNKTDTHRGVRTRHPSPSSHARRESHACLPMCVLCCALELKSEKCSVNDPRS